MKITEINARGLYFKKREIVKSCSVYIVTLIEFDSNVLYCRKNFYNDSYHAILNKLTSMVVSLSCKRGRSSSIETRNKQGTWYRMRYICPVSKMSILIACEKFTSVLGAVCNHHMYPIHVSMHRPPCSTMSSNLYLCHRKSTCNMLRMPCSRRKLEIIPET